MENRYRVYRRYQGIYYIEDVVTKRQESLRTRDKNKAVALLVARNQAIAQPALNVTMAKAYLSGRSPELSKRNWSDVFAEMTAAYDGSTKKRFGSFAKSAPIQQLKHVLLIETEASHFLNALRHPRAGSSTNKWMRIVHNRALDLGWLLAPVLARKVWPAFNHNNSCDGFASLNRSHQRGNGPCGFPSTGKANSIAWIQANAESSLVKKENSFDDNSILTLLEIGNGVCLSPKENRLIGRLALITPV